MWRLGVFELAPNGALIRTRWFQNGDAVILNPSSPYMYIVYFIGSNEYNEQRTSENDMKINIQRKVWQMLLYQTRKIDLQGKL